MITLPYGANPMAASRPRRDSWLTTATPADLRAKRPDLCAQIETEACESETRRLASEAGEKAKAEFAASPRGQAIRESAAKAERARAAQIIDAARQMRLDAEDAHEFIASGASPADAIEALKQIRDAKPMPSEGESLILAAARVMAQFRQAAGVGA